jgi:CMP-N-acetylneuraminic acid synthetase
MKKILSNGPQILGVTLARGGSKGVPGKNIRMLGGKPLIAYTVEECLKSELLSDYIVSTDDELIAQTSKGLGADVPFLRPKELATDTSSSASGLLHAVQFMENLHNKKYDYVVEIMATNPLKKSVDIDACIEKLHETRANAVVAVHRILDQHPARIKRIEGDLLVDFCVPEIPESRRQDLSPPAYIRSGSIYAINRDFLVTSGNRYDNFNTRPYILDSRNVINIDEEIDFLVAEKMIAQDRID